MSKKLSYCTFLGLVLGITTGLIAPQLMTWFSFIGDIYINLLKLLMIPILFCSIVCALVNSDTKSSLKIIRKVIVLFIIMFLVTFLINTGFVLLINPTQYFTTISSEWSGQIVSLTLKDFFVSIFPSNIITAAANNQILPVILFAFAFGIAATYKQETARSFNGINELNQIFYRMLGWVMTLTPLAVFSLIGTTTATYGKSIITNGLAYIITAWAGSIIVLLLVMIIPICAICNYNIFIYIKKISKIWLITLSTCSSAATLPNTINLCREEFGIPEEITNITVPLGCTIHMCGGAVSFSLLAIFCCHMYGIAITPVVYLTMIIAALLINMGAPGIPGGGIVIGATYLTLLGVPLDFIGLYAGIYKLLDMIYTTLNVTGDIAANCIINKVAKT